MAGEPRKVLAVMTASVLRDFPVFPLRPVLCLRAADSFDVAAINSMAKTTIGKQVVRHAVWSFGSCGVFASLPDWPRINCELTWLTAKHGLLLLTAS